MSDVLNAKEMNEKESEQVAGGRISSELSHKLLKEYSEKKEKEAAQNTDGFGGAEGTF